MRDTVPHPGGETRENIQRYKAQLPHARGKVAAALWMLLLSAVVMVGASFAWYTLSQAPEVTGMTTSVTGNGSLEIALSDADGLEPDSSAVGDSMSVSGQSVTVSNLTWGNLISLSDSAYGLDELVIYPSRLNISSLRTSPLMAVDYGSDGRVTALNSLLRYATWSEAYETWQIIGSTPQYGVRAVATVQTTSSGEADLAALKQEAQTKLAAAEEAYDSVISDTSYMSSLVTLVGDYLDYKLNGGDDRDYSSYTEDIYNMFLALSEAAEQVGKAYVAVAETYQYNIYGATEGVKNYTPYTLDDLAEKSEAEWAAEGVTLTGWDDYLSLVSSLESWTAKTQTIYNSALAGNTVSWSTIRPALVALFPYTEATYINKAYSSPRYYTWSELTSASVALSFICYPSSTASTVKSHTAYVQLNSGLLYDFEELVSCSAVTGTLQAHFTYQKYFGDTDLYIPMVVSTSAADDYVADAIAAAPEDTAADTGISTSRETYGMAIDLWVRTNASGMTYLLLDGALVTDDVGNVVGYEGSNRIWEDYNSVIVNGTSTTQGGGSCYVFYYDSAEELETILSILKGMSVVFYNTQTGAKLATASFDTTNYYENSGGRVTVPLAVDHTSSNLYQVETGKTVSYKVDEDGEYILDEDGERIEDEEVTAYDSYYYITALTPNEAVSITALLYLDGTAITNEQASAEENFTGTLNLQFASTAQLQTSASEDSDLYTEAVSLSATADETEHTWADDTDNMTTTVTLQISGSASPSTVTASYGRQINSGSQALKQQTVTLVQSSEDSSIWTMTYEFPAPGVYVLSNVTLDGKEYELEEAITVTVAGFTLDAVTWEYAESSHTVLTADGTISVPVTVRFAADYTGSQSVRAAFVSESGRYVYVTLSSADGLTWTGSASITASGIYTLKYFYIGSDIYDVSESMQKTLTVYMGLRATVRLSSASFEEGTTQILYDSEVGSYTVNVAVTLADNSGNPLRNITGTGGLAEGNTMLLRYGKTGSATGYLEAELTWSSTSSSYVGQFEVNDMGVFSFSQLLIGSEAVRYSASAPALVSASSVQSRPEYVANLTESMQTVINGTGVFAVQMLNSQTSWAIKAVVRDVDSNLEYTLDGKIGETDSNTLATTWTFPVVDENGDAMEGNFQLLTLQIYPVTYSGSDIIVGDMDSSIDVSEEGISAKIVTAVHITAAYDGTDVTSADYMLTGYAKTAVSSITSSTAESGNFYAAAPYDLSLLTVTVEDFEGDPIDGLEVADLAYAIDIDSTGDYGYTIVYNEASAPLSQTLTATQDADGVIYTFGTGTIGFNLWGEYISTLTYTVGDTGYQVNLGSLVYKGNSPEISKITLSTTSSNHRISNVLSYTELPINYTESEASRNNVAQDDSGNYTWTAPFYFTMSSGNTSQLLVNSIGKYGWRLPIASAKIYIANIYLVSNTKVWLTAEDGLVGDDGTVYGDVIQYVTNYYASRNFAYTDSITSAGFISGTVDGGVTTKSYGMIVGTIPGDTDATSGVRTSLYSATGERTLLGTYDTEWVPVLDYTTGEAVTDSNGDILYQEVITNYQPVTVTWVYVQYNGVTYRLDLANTLTINQPY